MILDIRSVIKGSVATLVAAVTVNILTRIPIFAGIAVVFFGNGAFLIPIGAGPLCGYFAPG